MMNLLLSLILVSETNVLIYDDYNPGSQTLRSPRNGMTKRMGTGSRLPLQTPDVTKLPDVVNGSGKPSLYRFWDT